MIAVAKKIVKSEEKQWKKRNEVKKGGGKFSL